MSINTATFLVLKQYLDEAMGDSLEFDTTTNITTNKSIVSTTLNQYDDGENGHFDDWWVEITEGNNSGVKRKVGSTTYATASGTLYVYGANLAAETGAVTCRLTRYDPTKKENALKRAIEEVYPTLHKKIDNLSLISGNWLPDSNFEDWATTTTLTHYSVNAAGTLAQVSSTGRHRFGIGAKLTAGAAGDYLYIDSDTYRRLLDLQDQTVNFYCWVYPEVADDASIEIYTVKNDGTTTQTLTSTTTCAAATLTPLKLEDQKLNDDLDFISIRFKIATNVKYVVFEDAYLGCSRKVYEYLLPMEYKSATATSRAIAHISKILMQDNGTTSDPAFFDFHPFSWGNSGKSIPFRIIPRYDVIANKDFRFIQLLEEVPNERRLRIIGDNPLESLSASTDTITLDPERIPLLTAKAREIFWKREATPVSPLDVGRFKAEAAEAERDYHRLMFTQRMSRPAELIKREWY